MAPVLTSCSGYKHQFKLTDQGRHIDSFSFSSSLSLVKFPSDFSTTKKLQKCRAEIHQNESSKLGSNGMPIKMVPTSEVMKRRGASHQKPVIINGSKPAVNGVSLVKKSTSSALVQTPKSTKLKKEPFTDELEVLPSDEGFSWAKDNYNSWLRTLDIWSFVLSLRLRVLFDNAKWAYLDGFSEDKQVPSSPLSHSATVMGQVQVFSLLSY